MRLKFILKSVLHKLRTLYFKTKICFLQYHLASQDRKKYIFILIPASFSTVFKKLPGMGW